MPDPAGVLDEASRREAELAPGLEKLETQHRAAREAAEKLAATCSELEALANEKHVRDEAGLKVAEGAHPSA